MLKKLIIGMTSVVVAAAAAYIWAANELEKEDWPRYQGD
jgi:hypothetical protein